MAKNYDTLADSLIELVGGKGNVSYLTHCVTRLRFNVKDRALVKEAEIKAVAGVLGAQWSGDQFQVIIGQDVADAYDAVCKKTGLAKQEPINENLDAPLKGLSLKRVGDMILKYVSGSTFAVIAMFVASALCNTMGVVLGPGFLNVISAESDIYILLTMLGNNTLNFLTVLIGYTACKSIGMDPVYGIFFGGLLIAPDFVAMVGVRETFTVFGIPCTVGSYSGNLLPVLLIVPICKVIYDFFHKHIPKALSALLVPLFTVLLTTPILFCAVAPLGTMIGNAFAAVLSMIQGSNIIITTIFLMIVAVAFPILITFGMHIPLLYVAGFTYMMTGSDTLIFPISAVYMFAISGLTLGAVVRVRNPEERSLVCSYFISSFIGGISEPAMFGLTLKYKRGMTALAIGCAAGGLICGILRPAVYIPGLVNVFTALSLWAAGGTTNLINGLIALGVSFVVCFVTGLLVIDYSKNNA